MANRKANGKWQIADREANAKWQKGRWLIGRKMANGKQAANGNQESRKAKGNWQIADGKWLKGI